MDRQVQEKQSLVSIFTGSGYSVIWNVSSSYMVFNANTGQMSCTSWMPFASHKSTAFVDQVLGGIHTVLIPRRMQSSTIFSVIAGDTTDTATSGFSGKASRFG